MFLVFAFAASVVAAKAQSTGASFGVKAGLNLSNLKAKYGDNTESLDTKPGFHVGAYANVPLASSLSFNPELQFAQEGAKQEEDGYKSTSKLNYLNLPLLVQYNASGFFAETGPQVGLLLSAKNKTEYDGQEEETDVKDDMNSTSFAWAIGLGYRMPAGLGIGARYNLGLSNLAKDAEDDYKIKSNVIQISLSYTLGK